MDRPTRLRNLRNAMTKAGVDAYFIPNTDPHQSEYIADHFKSLEWICGFTGSAGNVIITQDFAGLWTDSRYFIQGEDQLKGSSFSLMKLSVPHAPEYFKWLGDHLREGQVLGMDMRMFSVGLIRFLKEKLSAKKIEFKHVDLIGETWTDQPTLPTDLVYAHDIKFAGKSRIDKIEAIRTEMKSVGAQVHLLTALDDIAWTFNLRGSDVDYNPVFLSYAIVGLDEVILFVDDSKVPNILIGELGADGIRCQPYGSIAGYLSNLSSTCVWLSESNVNQVLRDALDSSNHIYSSSTAPNFLKAVKNEVELNHVRKVMEKDGVALVRFLMWLEEEVKTESLDEVKVAEQLYTFRAKQEGFKGESFSTIAGYKGHGAIVHYRATAATAYTLKEEGLFLLDSGGQYLDGTTDITRTLPLGKPTDEEKRDYTLVLKGHIQLAMAVFPKGMKGYQIESAARMPMWKYGVNYGHGTGHGVGFFLNVHEGPQSLGAGRTNNPKAGFVEGMLTSNEPGIYRANKHGIRIENLVIAKAYQKTEYGEFLNFETVTLCPIETSLIEYPLMTKEEVQWLNSYHEKVWNKLSPHLNQAEKDWLKEKVKKI